MTWHFDYHLSKMWHFFHNQSRKIIKDVKIPSDILWHFVKVTFNYTLWYLVTYSDNIIIKWHLIRLNERHSDTSWHPVTLNLTWQVNFLSAAQKPELHSSGDSSLPSAQSRSPSHFQIEEMHLVLSHLKCVAMNHIFCQI